MAGLKVITPPASEPVTLEEAKLHIRVDSNDEDELIGKLITAAREYCESFQNRAYITQTLELALDGWPCGDAIELPWPPLQSVTSVVYTDDDGNDTTWTTSNYIVDDYSFVTRIVRKKNICWPTACLASANGIKIRYVAGYGTADKVPQRVKQAMLLLIGHWYDRREAVLTGSISKEVEFAVHALLSIDRVVPV